MVHCTVRSETPSCSVGRSEFCSISFLTREIILSTDLLGNLLIGPLLLIVGLLLICELLLIVGLLLICGLLLIISLLLVWN